MTEAENASQVTDKAEHLDQSGYDPLLEKCRTNLKNSACELTKNCSGLIPNNISQHTTLEGVSYVSSDVIGRSVENSDRNSKYSEIVKEPLCEADWDGLLFESFEQIDPIAKTDLQSNVLESCTVVSGFSHAEQQKECSHPEENPAAQSHYHGHDAIVPGQLTNNYEPSFQEITEKSMLENVEDVPDDTSKSNSCQYQVVIALQSSSKSYSRSNETPSRKAAAELKSSTLNICRSSGLRFRKTPKTKVESEYTLRSSSGGRRRWNSDILEETAASEPDSNLDKANDGRKRGAGNRQGNRKSHDEFSKMKIRLRYLLHRMRYEQNLIDAYSSEGWRGQSLEKLRPEKELQRAKLDINRSKFKIRGLFQHIDAICAEGKFPESLFDSEGLIHSEDIFCAKCGSKDLSSQNDIILCDGTCDRGFHQLCLDPPLQTEDIPPGDESWFCPACDCKSHCIQLLNDSVGTKISNSESWEHVFPEAEKTVSTLDDASELPSDDSADDDYNPNGVDDYDDHDDDSVGNESTSDESDFSSASEDLGAIPKQNNDYNPNFAPAEKQPKQGSSSSDYVSASEDLNDISNNEEVVRKDGSEISPSQLVHELDNSLLVSGRRKAGRLDYKKLHDETYGNTSTASSDDEDWKDALTPKRRKKVRRRISSESNEGEEWEDVVTPKRRRYVPKSASSLNPGNGFPVAGGGMSSVVGDTSTTGKTPPSTEIGVSDISRTPITSSGCKKQPYKRLGENVTQRLYASFKENQYPDRATKEKLAAELGLSTKQVDKWFGNARWSFNHSPAVQDSSTSGVASKGIDNAPNVGESSGTKTIL